MAPAPPAPESLSISMLASLAATLKGAPPTELLKDPDGSMSIVLLRANATRRGPAELALVEAGLAAISGDLASSTKRHYEGAFRRFAEFTAGLQPPLPHLPASSYTLFLYLCHLGTKEVNYGTMKTACAAVDFFHRAHLIPAAERPSQSEVIRMLRQAWKRPLSIAHANHMRRKQPLPVDVLVDIAELFGAPDTELVTFMGCCYLVASFAGLMRYSDWTAVMGRHVVIGDKSATITVLTRKNDKACDNHLVFLREGTTAACPVSLLRRYKAALEASDAEHYRHLVSDDLPFFRSVRSAVLHGDAHPTPGSTPMTYDEASACCLSMIAKATGLPLTDVRAQFGTHSLRKGGASTMFNNGATVEEVQRAGGWASADMPWTYITRNEVRRGDAARLMGL